MKPTPSPITTYTGNQHKITRTIDDFFVETKNFIVEKYEVEEEYFEIKSGELSYQPPQITNDRITYLCHQDIILASVFETRTQFNHVRYTFFRNLKEFGELLL